MTKKQPEDLQTEEERRRGKEHSISAEQSAGTLAGENQDWLRLLQTGLDQLDDMYPVAEPRLHWISAQLEEQQTVLHRRFVRDFSIFISLALVVITGMTIALLQLPALFVVSQIAVLVIGPSAILLDHRRNRKREVER